jgi:hypothetical protein
VWDSDRNQGLLVSHTVDFLRKPRVLQFAGEVKTLDGSDAYQDEDMMQWLRDEMGSWLAAHEVGGHSEFPQWETCQNMRIFDVQQPTAQTAEGFKVAAERICRRFSSDFDIFWKEFQTMLPVAQRKAPAAKDCHEAWQLGVERVEDRARPRIYLGTLRLHLALHRALQFLR